MNTSQLFFVNFDLTAFLSPDRLGDFRRRTGLIRSPATLILPSQEQADLIGTPHIRTVVAFLHGMGAGRWTWGLDNDNDTSHNNIDHEKRRNSLALQVMTALWEKDPSAVGLVLAGLGHDGSRLSDEARRNGITPRQYADQLLAFLEFLGGCQGKKLIFIGHSIGAAALWEVAEELKGKADVVIIAISPVRAIADSRFLSWGCRLSSWGLWVAYSVGGWLHLLSTEVQASLAALAATLRGVGHQGRFRGILEGSRGAIILGQRDWVARRRLRHALARARCPWPVTELPGQGHDLLSAPDTTRAVLQHLKQLI